MTLVECGDHKKAPAVIICVHLINGESTEWCPIPSDSLEVEHDWLCRECFNKMDTIEIDDLRTVCMHCARELQGK